MQMTARKCVEWDGKVCSLTLTRLPPAVKGRRQNGSRFLCCTGHIGGRRLAAEHNLAGEELLSIVRHASNTERCCTRRAAVWDRLATSATETTALRRDRVINRMLASASSSSSCSQWDQRRRFTSSSSSSPSNSLQPSQSLENYDFRWGRWLWYVRRWRKRCFWFNFSEIWLQPPVRHLRCRAKKTKKTNCQKLIDEKWYSTASAS